MCIIVYTHYFHLYVYFIRSWVCTCFSFSQYLTQSIQSINDIGLKPSFYPQRQIKSETQSFPLPVQFKNALYYSSLEFLQFFVSRRRLALSPLTHHSIGGDFRDLSLGLDLPSPEPVHFLPRFSFYLLFFCLLCLLVCFPVRKVFPILIHSFNECCHFPA